jgi:hypothetical protein
MRTEEEQGREQRRDGRRFTLVYKDSYDESLQTYTYESLEDLIEDCEAEEIDPSECLVFQGAVEPMGLKSSYALTPFVEDEDEEDDE